MELYKLLEQEHTHAYVILQIALIYPAHYHNIVIVDKCFILFIDLLVYSTV